MGFATDLQTALDAGRFATAVGGLVLDDWQRDALRSTSDRILFNCARQTGKSTIAALLALHTALYRPGALGLLLSPSLRQSSELFRLVASFYHNIGTTTELEAESALRLRLANGSRVVSLPGKERTVRGYSGVDLLVIDEAARVEDELYYAVRPMLAVSGGRLLALSTPFGKRGWWFDEWTQGGDAWDRYRVTAMDCPRIPQAFLDEEQEHLGEWWFRQEYLCEFMESESASFTYDVVMGALAGEVEQWQM